MSDRGQGGLRAVERAITVLNILAEHPSGISLADLARVSEIPMTTLHRLLQVLRSASLVGETTTGLHTVGVGTVVLSRAFLDGVDLRDVAKPEMAKIVADTSETCHLGILASVHIVYLEKIDSPHPVRMYSRIGATNPALTTAIGRAILAYSPDSVVTEVIEGSTRLFDLASDQGTILQVLEVVRRNGYSTDLQDNEVGICCVGAPVFDHTGRVVAGISLSTPGSRFDPSRVEETGAMVAATADRVSHALGWPGRRSSTSEER
ncbi:IclR family transcriptional regulator [Amycolatopsis palatopharyngis]|uniref:IclR family transcriptional regulator n=1 Tax=Amycolatopsis palatopharyngis TaxID=187982 RepID=UPI000E2267EB|nr:IclR family transcriptional regulator [Amycolatopsis palatopharyngis]